MARSSARLSRGGRSVAPRFYPDQVLPAALTDPRRAAAREKRWAKLTAEGSLLLVGIFGMFAQLFHGTKVDVVAEQEARPTATGGAMQPAHPDEGAPRFAGRVRLHYPPQD